MSIQQYSNECFRQFYKEAFQRLNPNYYFDDENLNTFINLLKKMKLTEEQDDNEVPSQDTKKATDDYYKFIIDYFTMLREDI